MLDTVNIWSILRHAFLTRATSAQPVPDRSMPLRQRLPFDRRPQLFDRDSREAGFQEHLVKPVEPAILAETLAHLCAALTTSAIEVGESATVS